MPRFKTHRMVPESFACLGTTSMGGFASGMHSAATFQRILPRVLLAGSHEAMKQLDLPRHHVVV